MDESESREIQVRIRSTDGIETSVSCKPHAPLCDVVLDWSAGLSHTHRKYNFLLRGQRLPLDAKIGDLSLKPHEFLTACPTLAKKPALPESFPPITQQVINHHTRNLQREEPMEGPNALDLLRIIAELEEKQLLLLQAKEQIRRLYEASLDDGDAQSTNALHDYPESAPAEQSEAAASASWNPAGFVAIPGLPSILPEQLQPLIDMGFSELAARKALYLDEMSIPKAIERLLTFGDEESFLVPFTDDELSRLRECFQRIGPIPFHVHKLSKLGFTEVDCVDALKQTLGDFHAAHDILRKRSLRADGVSIATQTIGDSVDGEEGNEGRSAQSIARMLFSQPAIQQRISDDASLREALEAIVCDPSRLPEFLESNADIGELVSEIQRASTDH